MYGDDFAVISRLGRVNQVMASSLLIVLIHPAGKS